HECGSAVESALDSMIVEEKLQDDESTIGKTVPPRRTPSASRIPTDLSDTTESDGEKQIKIKPPLFLSWEKSFPRIHPSTPDSDDTVPVLQSAKKTTDLTQTPWTHNPSDNSKSRIVNLTVALNQAMGPKTAQVTENQVMLPCSKAGQLYAIDVDTINAGVPYADSFNIGVHYCLQKMSETESSIQVFAQVNYKKSVWGLVKGMIEKNCWSGLEDFYASLSKSLHLEGEENVPDIKRKSRRKRRIHSMPRPGVEDPRSLMGATNRMKMSSGGVFSSDVATMIVFTVLILLVVLNVMLYFKLWSLEESPPYTLLDLHILKDPPKSHDEWIKLLQQQETLHSVEIQKWQRILKTAIQLLKQTEESLNELQRSISPTYTNKVMSILQNHKDAVEQTRQEEL
ncbi:GRAM domain-containing protein 1B-like, partial [Asbolus verrucosus]